MKNKRVVIFVNYAQKYSSFIVKKHNKSMVDELVDFRIYFLLFDKVWYTNYFSEN